MSSGGPMPGFPNPEPYKARAIGPCHWWLPHRWERATIAGCVARTCRRCHKRQIQGGDGWVTIP